MNNLCIHVLTKDRRQKLVSGEREDVRDAHQWGIGTGPSLEHGETLHLPDDRGHLTHTPMSDEDVQWKSL